MISSLVPDALTSQSATILIAASFFTSGLTAAAGIGGGLLMLALMTYFIPIAVLIPIHGLVQFGSNAGRAFVQRANANWRVAVLFSIGALFGAAVGSLIAVKLPENVLLTIFGIFIIIMVLVKFPPITNASNTIVAIGGATTTFASMFVGATGPLVAVFINKIAANHREALATHGVTMAFQHLFKVVAFFLVGVALWQWVPFVIAMIASGYIGTLTGTALMNRLPDETLQKLFKVILILISIDMLRRGLGLF